MALDPAVIALIVGVPIEPVVGKTLGRFVGNGLAIIRKISTISTPTGILDCILDHELDLIGRITFSPGSSFELFGFF